MSAAQGSNLPLPAFYVQVLHSLVPIFDDTLSLSDLKTQEILSTALDNLHLISRMLSSLGVFSDNESLDEVGDGELVFMTVPWVLGECEAKAGLGGRDNRIAALRRSDTAINAFLHLLNSYKVLSPDEEAESSAMANGVPKDPARRREAKIRAYKREKELREFISASVPDQPDPTSSPLVFILSCLPRQGQSNGSTSVNEEEPDTRRTILLILRLLHTLALALLASTAMELELLVSAPAEISELPQEQRGSEIDNTWKLDRTPAGYKPRELISGGGRVLRPFTILPSTSGLSDRERLRGEVFRESWRLPSMTIDEYLEEEKRRGNIITGGGQASYDAPTSSELLALAAEQDGAIAGEEKEEQKRLKEENWAQYTEVNPRGAGNRMNRG
ncbi:hypothetical protein M231_00596 [Tremella mesenterica]|uniref:TAP42-like protein n=1 Tax=Tremella mesenterica TaxID=5217 RepID=A0A4V1M510_TREME|nr:hypothetical protein M231_00596 [Tremella mesenterica]